MTSVGRLAEQTLKGAWIFLALAVLVAAVFWRGYTWLPGDLAVPSGRAVSVPAWPESGSVFDGNWSVFQNPGAVIAAGSGSLASRYRLAGTFFAFGGEQDSRKAIIETIQGGGDRIVSEGERIDGVTVVRVFHDSVILREGASEEQLWLSFSKAAGGVAHGGAGPEAGRTEAVGETDRFGGKRIGEDRWVFKRQSILDYYSELRDQPERLVQVFDSMKPLYDESGSITGYHLGIEGEREFFTSVGLREGDVVRGVNSMKMTSRRRAEYFIKEFVANRANAFIIEIEREGVPHKLMYEVR